MDSKYCFRCGVVLIENSTGWPFITINNPATLFHFKCYFCLQCFATLTQLAMNRKDRVFLIKGGEKDAYSSTWKDFDT